MVRVDGDGDGDSECSVAAVASRLLVASALLVRLWARNGEPL